MADINLTHTGAELDEAIEKALTDFSDVDGVTAIAAHVLAGDIFVDATGNVVGTMPNRGAVTGEASAETPYAIQEGYHNGLGVVTAGGGGGAPDGILVQTTSGTTLAANFFKSKIGVVSVTLPSGFTTIGASAFESCSNMISITMPNTVAQIEDSAFAYCTSLALSAIPESITHIGVYTFRGCPLTITHIPESIIVIKEYAFAFCSSLTKLWISNSCLIISAPASTQSPFYGCSNGLVFYCEAASKPAGWSEFWNCLSVGVYLTVNWGVTKEAFDLLP